MLPSEVVRVGFLTHLLWDRYGPFWRGLAESVGAEVVRPTPDAVIDRLADRRLSQVPGVAARLAVATALALDGVDLVVVPQLNPDDGGRRGAAQDPWVADLPTMLARVAPGLPAVWAVPADLRGPVDGAAVTFLHRLTTDAGLARRAWSRHRAEARPPRRPAPAPAAAGRRRVALLGQPWWTTPAMAELASHPGEHVTAASVHDPEALRVEGRRWEQGLVDSDAEALGALRRSARAASVDALRWIVDEDAPADLWLTRRARERAGERLEVVALRDLGAEPVVRALLAPGAGDA